MSIDLLHRVIFLIPLILSLTVHEWAHAFSARLLGDDTAERSGRLTLNPLSHIDPIGTLLMPLIMQFGWAKPVPVNPARFRRGVRMGTGMMLTAAAGPVSNLALALLCVVITGLMWRFSLRNDAIAWLLTTGFELNVLLALFNLLPIPPLDGSRIVDGLMPLRLRPQWERIVALGPVLLLALFVLPSVLGLSFFRWPLHAAWLLASDLVKVIAGSA